MKCTVLNYYVAEPLSGVLLTVDLESHTYVVWKR
jgi:hypothetical protein